MKRLFAALVVLALVAVPVLAADDAAKDITLKGKLVKAEKDGKVSYSLTTADGDVAVPAPVAKEGAAVIKLDEFVGADVEVAAKGTAAEKDGKKVVTIKEVVSVKKVEAAKEAAK